MKLQTDTIVVDQAGTKLAYVDSGAPSGAYTTIFAVHGLGFNSGIFERVQEKAKDANVRFVAVTRRNYEGSTPFSEAELDVIAGGTEKEKTTFMINRGVELLVFIDKFLVEKKTPSSQEGNPNGGVAIIGWSLGNTVTLAAIAHLCSAAPEVQVRLAPLIHTLILHEPSKNILGHTPEASNWLPLTAFDQTILEDAEIPFFAWWVSAYFQHGDLSTREHEVLQYQVPAFNLRPPTAYSLSSAGRISVIESGSPAKTDIPYLSLSAQLLASYNAVYSKEARDLLPNMKVFLLSGENSPAFAPSTTWMVEDHDKQHGGGFIRAKMLKEINHFSMWDDPEITLQAYLDCIARTF